MTKNEVLKTLIDSLLSQRLNLVNELTEINHNEGSFSEKRSTISDALFSVDSQVSNYITMLE